MRDAVEQRRQVGVLDRRFHEPEPLAPPVLLEVRFLDRARVVVGEAVEADDRRALVEQRRRQVRPDEARGARDERLHAKTSRTRSGSRHGLPDGSTAACTVLPAAAIVWSSRPHHLVVELHAHRRQHPSFRPHFNLVVVPRRPQVLAVGLDHRQRDAGDLHFAVAPAEGAQQVGAGHLEPDEVVRVVDHPHFIGFGVADPQAWRPTTGIQRRDRRGSAAARRSRMARSGSGDPNTALPATRMSAPAATIRGAVRTSIPPSTSIGAALPSRRSNVAHGPNLRLRPGDESLPAEAGVDRHHQDVVHVAGNLLERADRRRRVERHARLRAEALDQVHRRGAGARPPPRGP